MDLASGSSSLPSRPLSWVAAPEGYLAAAAATTLVIMGGVFVATTIGGFLPSVLVPAGWALKILFGFSWAATIGIGLTSRAKAFRLLGLCTAAGAAVLYFLPRLTGTPSYTLFGVTGLLALGMYTGTLVAWWVSRRRRDVA